MYMSYIYIYLDTYVIEYYSVLERNEILRDATIWINHENIMPSEINHTKGPIVCICEVPRVVRFIEAEIITEASRNWKEGE
jgi:hypothetical protein